MLLTLGSLVPVASHPNVAIDACTGRLLMMEHEVKSLHLIRTFNSYLYDFVSHFALLPTFSRMGMAGFGRSLNPGTEWLGYVEFLMLSKSRHCELYAAYGAFYYISITDIILYINKIV